MSEREKGFTLIELMVSLVVVGILLLVAVPNFGNFVAQSRVDSVKNKLVSSIALARSEAIKRGVAVAVCRKNPDPALTCVGTAVVGSKDWSDGWLVFLDEDDNQTAAANEIIKVYADIDDTSTIQYSLGDVIVFDGFGLLNTISSNEEEFAIGDTGDSTIGAGLSIRPTGRIRACVNWTVSAATCGD